MIRNNPGVRTRGRFAAGFTLSLPLSLPLSLALFATLPACGENMGWNDLPLPLLMWTQEEGSVDQPSSHCVYTRVVDAEWNAWQDEWCENADGEVSPLGAMSPSAREAIHQGFEALKTAEPNGRWSGPCPTNRRHKFVMKEPIPRLEEPTTWTQWVLCAGPRDDLTNLEEPFATIANALLQPPPSL